MYLRKCVRILLLCLLMSIFSSVYCTSPLQLGARKPLASIFGQQKSKFSTVGGLVLSKAAKYRLPQSVIPLHYQLDIRPILDESDSDFLSAPGFVKIEVNCVEETNTISLHSLEIEINTDEVVVRSLDLGEIVASSDHVFDLENESYTIHLENSLLVGRTYSLEIPFTAKVATDRLNGLYLSSYKESSQGEIKYLAATQFQDLFARKAFVCFDEPALKENFSIRIGRQLSFNSLSNTVITETLPIDNMEGWFWDVYKTTEKMSTYLVAFTVSQFESEVAPESLYDKPVSVWAPPNLVRSGTVVFAAESSAKTLKYFDEYLDFKYTFPKMDSSSVPDFHAGAMENWGLNNYMPLFILYIEGETTQYEKYFVSAIIAHELAHQWFGNLVTMQWWNSIWLNEGLTTYLMFLGSAASQPQFNAMDRMVNDAVQLAMNFDEKPQTTPTQSNITDEMVYFPRDVIYERGASLIRMMESFLTKDTLQKGLQNYLKRNAYGTVVQDDMFQDLTQQAHLDGTLSLDMTVKEIMDPWTFQPGFPIIRVNKAGSSRIYLSQERFYYTPLLDSTIPENYFWRVPISYVTKSNPEISTENLKPKLWIERNQIIVSHPVETDQWILINTDAMNYYRVIYDKHFESLLQDQLLRDHNIISPASRSQLLDDYFKAAFARYISISRTLEFTKYLHNETSLSVWMTVSNNLREAYPILTDTDLLPPFIEYFTTKVNAPLSRIGLEPTTDESPVLTSLRAELLDWSCSMESEVCVQYAESVFEEWISNPNVNPMGADVQPMLYCAAAISGNIAITEFIMQKYKSDISDRQKSLFLKALACTKNASLLSSYLDMAIATNSEIPNSDAAELIKSVAKNSIGRQIAFSFIQLKYLEIINYLGLNSLTDIVNSLSQYFASEELLIQMSEFKTTIQHLLDDEANASFSESLKNIQSNIMWLDLHYNPIKEWLQSAL